MPYHRTIPRDLFNESKLLKCLGQVSLLVHDGKGGKLKLRHHKPTRGFVIEQDESDGSLYCANLECRLADGTRVWLSSSYNSKHPYPLTFNINDKHYGDVLNDDGTFTGEFLELIR